MLPPVFALLSTDADVGARLGAGNACRCYPNGKAPTDVGAPYATWLTVAGSSENTLADPPPVDSFVGQIDVWADDLPTLIAAATPIRAAIERYGQVTAYNPGDADPATGRLRYSFDAEFVVKR